jgi:hypothetical protein
MIVFNIVLKDQQLAEDIAGFVIQRKYAINAHVDTNDVITETGKLQTIRLFFVTKALLYDVIEKEIVQKYGEGDLIIYATPVIHISKKFGDQLRAKLAKA